MNNQGIFNGFGGQHVSEELAVELNRIADLYAGLKEDPAYLEEIAGLMKDYSGRETPLYFAENLTRDMGGAKIYLKREDLNHLGAHKITNALGQAVIAKRMGKTRLIAETGAGQHGVATAAIAAKLGMACTVYMGDKDMARQKLNVFRMQLMGTEVAPVNFGHGDLEEAVDAAFEDLAQNYEDTFYLVGSAVGPHPYPTMVRDFQSIISKETKAQILEKEGRLPNAVIACVGGGSNSIGSFHHFINDPDVALYGAEGGGKGVDSGQTAASLNAGAPKVQHGMYTYVLQDEDGNTIPSYSVSAGLDYPAVSPEHSAYHESGRVTYQAINDDAALHAFQMLSKLEGIIPALESSHAVALAMELAPTMAKDDIIVVTLSGRGDKDVPQIMEIFEDKV